MKQAANPIRTLPFVLETVLECRIASDPAWQVGLEWGVRRPGHPEGKVSYHIRDVLQNVERFYGAADNRPLLRLIALVHDTFKYQSAQLAAVGQKISHGLLARQFATRYMENGAVLQVVELHDEAYRAYLRMERDGDGPAAVAQAGHLIQQLGDALPLFLQFYHCDSHTGDKSLLHYQWFAGLALEK